MCTLNSLSTRTFVLYLATCDEQCCQLLLRDLPTSTNPTTELPSIQSIPTAITPTTTSLTLTLHRLFTLPVTPTRSSILPLPYVPPHPSSSQLRSLSPSRTYQSRTHLLPLDQRPPCSKLGSNLLSTTDTTPPSSDLSGINSQRLEQLLLTRSRHLQLPPTNPCPALYSFLEPFGQLRTPIQLDRTIAITAP